MFGFDLMRFLLDYLTSWIIEFVVVPRTAVGTTPPE
eukprot:COSAG02_NODE_45058_length_360_cov_1.371648_1_plen_35_part_01